MAAVAYLSGDPSKVDVADVGQHGGPAGPLDGSGLIPSAQIPGGAGSAVQLGGDIGGTTSSPQVTGTHLGGPLPIAQGGTAGATASAARTALGLGGAALLAVGTSSGTVAAGDDSRVTGAAQKASNLSDVASVSTARTNLGLGSAALLTAGGASGVAQLDSDTLVPDAQSPANARRPSDHGVAGWTFPSWAIQSGGNANYAVLGQVYVARLRILRTTTITKGWVYIATAPSGTPTNAYLGLYDSGGTRRAVTTDQGSAWLTTGLKNPSFSASYAAAPGEYYVAVLIGSLSAGSTMPALAQATIGGALTGMANFNLSAGSGAGLLYGTTGTSLTALPSTITPGSLTASERAVWAAVA